MGLQIDKLRSALIEEGYEVQSVHPQRAPDGRVKVVVSILKQADAAPAPGPSACGVQLSRTPEVQKSRTPWI
jgi:hypothetical protein